MKKNFILGIFLIGLFVTSFASAGLIGDFLGKLFSRGNEVGYIEIPPMDKEVIDSGYGVLTYLDRVDGPCNNAPCISSERVYYEQRDIYGERNGRVVVFIEKYPRSSFGNSLEKVNHSLNDVGVGSDARVSFDRNRRYYFAENWDAEPPTIAYLWDSKNSQVAITYEFTSRKTLDKGGIDSIVENYLREYPSILPENSPVPVRDKFGYSGGNGNSSPGGSYGGGSQVTYQGILDMFRDNCRWHSVWPEMGYADRTISCEEYCSSIGSQCVTATIHEQTHRQRDATSIDFTDEYGYELDRPTSCNLGREILDRSYQIGSVYTRDRVTLNCYCCSLP